MFGLGPSRCYSDLLLTGVCDDRIPVRTIFCARLQIDTGAPSASCAICTGTILLGKAARELRLPTTRTGTEVKCREL